MSRPSAPDWQVWTALWLVYILWGSTFLGIAFVVESMPPFMSAALRFAAASLLVGAWVVLRRGARAFRMTLAQAGNAAVVGVLLLMGGNGLVVVAQDADLPSGLAALLVAAVPLWVVLLRWAWRDRPAAATAVGVGIGFLGLALLLLPGARPTDVPLGPAAAVLVGSLLWSIGTFYASRRDLPRDPLATTSVEMAAGAAALVVAAAVTGERLVVSEVSRASWLGLAYLVVFGSIVAFTAFSWLLRVAPVSKVATYAYVNPVVAVGLGVVVLDEAVTTVTVVGGALTLLAVAVVVRQEGRATPPPAAPDVATRDPEPEPTTR